MLLEQIVGSRWFGDKVVHSHQQLPQSVVVVVVGLELFSTPECQSGIYCGNSFFILMPRYSQSLQFHASETKPAAFLFTCTRLCPPPPVIPPADLLPFPVTGMF